MQKRVITFILCVVCAMLAFSYIVVIVDAAAGEGIVEVSVP